MSASFISFKKWVKANPDKAKPVEKLCPDCEEEVEQDIQDALSYEQ